MILGNGIDIVEIERMAGALTQHGARFRNRIFTDQEILYCDPKARAAQHYAGRFAAKEAAFKALGTGWSRGLSWHDVEVVSAINGPPTLALHGLALEIFQQKGGTRLHLSISHTERYAVAFVIFEGPG